MTLLAREPFKRGDYGIAQKDGVYRLQTGAFAVDALVVIALADIQALQRGEFQEAQPASEQIH